ncbi:MAG: two-component sensor histidine kinase [Alteromonadaceae bacterium]|nr:MAG: two-component sensor histidine kinase [Alteromonadaceae bacterium]
MEAKKLKNDHSTVAPDVLDALPHPVIMVGNGNQIVYANQSTENFLQSSLSIICKRSIDYFMPFGSPVLALVEQVRNTNSSFNEYKVDVSSPRLGKDKLVDVYASTSSAIEGAVVLQFLPRGVAEKIDRQLTHRGAARTVTGLAAMLAHEIKNPLSGIRGAAQLLEMSASDEDRSLTQLIKDETDRIVQLVDRMEVFSDDRPLEQEPVNIHAVLERVKKIASNGFAKDIVISEKYDPSLPLVKGNHDQLVQVFLNLVKNAAEVTQNKENPSIKLETGFRPGVHLSVPGANERVALPIELIVHDNGSGISEDDISSSDPTAGYCSKTYQVEFLYFLF